MSDKKSFHSYDDDYFGAGGGRDAEERAADVGQSESLNWRGISDDGKGDLFEEGTTVFETGKGSAADFGYGDAFDDSAPSWYRQSSFRYDGYRDYSPSRLFRSSFSSFRSVYYASSEENEAKNKAIRALRTLTRNANTVADATTKITYVVQFSSGADSNGVSADLAEGKQQVIYVSPDSVIATKDADAEDAEIDALTGFVLLRVQIAQEVNTQIIADINSTSMRAVPRKLMQFICNPKSATAAPAEIAAGAIDNYAAGIIAKSMITRLSRRTVVQSWGGFAPYFVRHAKKFSHVREKLTDGKPSVELLCAQIAYNMIADETEIAIAPEVSKIVDKHLGSKVAWEDILAACIALVADLREYLKSTAEPGESPAGEIEQAITDLLQEFAAPADEEEAKREQKMREGLSQAATFFDKIQERTDEISSTSRLTQIHLNTKFGRMQAEMREAQQAERIVTAAKNAAKQLSALAESPSPYVGSARFAEDSLKQTLAHFAAAVAKAEAAGVKMPDIAKSVGEDKAAMKEKAEKLQEYAKQLAKMLRNHKAEFRKELAEIAAAGLTKTNKAQQGINEMHAAAEEQLRDGSARTAESPRLATLLPIVEIIKASLSERLARSEYFTKVLQNMGEKESLSAAKSVTQLLDRATRLQRAIAETDTLETNPVEGMHYPPAGTDNAAITFKNHALEGHREWRDSGESIAQEQWHETAIDRFINDGKMSKAQIAAIAANAATGNLLRNLLNAMTTGDDYMPTSFDGFTDAQIEKINKAARSMGISAQELFELLSALDGVNPDDERAATIPGKAGNNAKDVGERIKETITDAAELMSPVDEQLFGEKVESKTTILDPKSLSHANEEAQHAAEEEYVAYLSSDESRPALSVRQNKKAPSSGAKKLATQIKIRNRGAIERIKNALQFQSAKRTGEIHGTRSGDLDDGSLHKLRYDSEYIWSQKTIAKLPDVAVGILVDQSGSMSGGKIDEAREMCIVLAEALKKIEGMHLHIYGHTANMQSQKDLVLFEHYSSQNGVNNADLSRLGDIAAFQNNYDGYAIKETAKLLNMDSATRKYLFVIADGLPHGNGYAGEDAQKHVKSVCSFVRTRLKIPTYAFAIGVHNATHKDSFKTQYGANNVMFLSKVTACLPQIVRFLRNTLQKEKTLVSASAD